LIRPFQTDDAQACSDIIRACIREDPQLSPQLQAKLLALETPAAVLERARLYYLAVHQSEEGITGLGGLELNEIRILSVSPAHQREGIGRALVEHLGAMVPPALFKDIFVYSMPGAVAFYRALGFEERGAAAFLIGGLKMETIFMIRTSGWV
jgi:GNAT superfamily N-acetyltransferase